MSDIRLKRMAQVLVHYSLGLKQGERLAIRADAQKDAISGLSCGKEEMASGPNSRQFTRTLSPRQRLVSGQNRRRWAARGARSRRI